MIKRRFVLTWFLVLIGTMFVSLGCAMNSIPKTFVRSVAGWKTIELRPGLVGNYADAWETAVDTVARKWDIEVMDRNSGYLRTSWIFHIFTNRQGYVHSNYMGRLTLKFEGVENPTKVEVKTEARMTTPQGWLYGYDSAFERDVFSALSGRLGRTVPEG